MDLKLDGVQILQLLNETNHANEAATDATGAYALVYAKILSFIDPEIAVLLLTLIRDPDNPASR